MTNPSILPRERPLRVLLGTHEICRQLYDLAEGFRRLGHTAETLIYYFNPQHGDLGYTFAEHPSEIASTLELIRLDSDRAMIERSSAAERLRRYFGHYDLYVFQFASSLLPGNADYPLLKQRGKRIISLFNGSDVRHWSSAEPVWDHYGLRVPSMYREEPFRRLNPQIFRMRMAERFADSIFSLPSHSELALRPYHHFYVVVDPRLYRHHVPARDVPIIVHAPSRRATKGTEEFLATLDRLRDEGVRFELRLLEGRSNQEVIQALEDADVVLDQLDSSTYGMLALEAMATGCAVAGGNQPDFIPQPQDRPVVHVDQENMRDVIRRLIVDVPYRTELAHAGQAFVERYHDPASVAQRLIDSLDPRIVPDYMPTFFAENYRLPERDTVTPVLQQLTADVVQRNGLPEGVAPDDLVARGLMSPLEAHAPPVMHWKPSSTAIKKEFWGWSPSHKANDGGEEIPAGRITGWVQQALRALDLADHETAGQLLRDCVEFAERYSSTLADRATLVAIGRLATALGEDEIAETMFDAARRTPDGFPVAA